MTHTQTIQCSAVSYHQSPPVFVLLKSCTTQLPITIFARLASRLAVSQRPFHSPSNATETATCKASSPAGQSTVEHPLLERTPRQSNLIGSTHTSSLPPTAASQGSPRVAPQLERRTSRRFAAQLVGTSSRSHLRVRISITALETYVASMAIVHWS